jgi:hypothetical protein
MIDQPDDDIAKTLIEGDTYEQAALNVDRFIPLSLAAKLYLAVGTLALSVTVAPAVMFRRELVRSLEGTNSLSLTLGVLVLNGILTTVLGGVLLVRQQYIVDNSSLTVKQARKLVRLEDLYVLAVILGGMFIAASAALVWVGVVAPGVVETLYSYDARVYQPDETLGVDLRLISALGGFAAVLLFLLWKVVCRR